MDPVVGAAVITGLFGVIVALIAWRSNSRNTDVQSRTAAEQATERTLSEQRRELEAARAATSEERQQLLELRDKRLEEMADQLGSARISLAEERQRRKELEAEVEGLQRRIAVCDDELAAYRRRLTELEGEQP